MKKNYQSTKKPLIGKFLSALGILASVAFSVHGQTRMVIANNTFVNVAGGSPSNPSVLVVNNSAVNAISAQGNGHINSEGQFNVLQWNVEDGTGNFVVPFADNAANALPISLNVTTAGSNEGVIRFSMYGTGQDNLPLPQGVASIAHANDPNNLIPADGAKLYDRFWFIVPTGYITNPEGSMGFSYSTANMSGDLTSGVTAMAAQSHNGTSWDVSQSGSDDLNGNVTGVPFTSNNFNATWTLVENGAPLPITLLSFNAIWGDDRQSYAKVFWSTASEESNDYFDVERSADGANWQRIDRVDGAGTSINTINYETLDLNPLNGIAYYRLRQVDFDGSVAYTHIVALKREINEAAISVYPNPASNQFQVAFEGFKGEEATIKILDNSGRIVLTHNANILNNPVQIINASGFQSGVYYIHVTSETESLVEKIVIKN